MPGPAMNYLLSLKGIVCPGYEQDARFRPCSVWRGSRWTPVCEEIRFRGTGIAIWVLARRRAYPSFHIGRSGAHLCWIRQANDGIEPAFGRLGTRRLDGRVNVDLAVGVNMIGHFRRYIGKDPYGAGHGHGNGPDDHTRRRAFQYGERSRRVRPEILCGASIKSRVVWVCHVNTLLVVSGLRGA